MNPDQPDVHHPRTGIGEQPDGASAGEGWIITMGSHHEDSSVAESRKCSGINDWRTMPFHGTPPSRALSHQTIAIR